MRHGIRANYFDAGVVPSAGIGAVWMAEAGVLAGK